LIALSGTRFPDAQYGVDTLHSSNISRNIGDRALL
jgi:hypothetical protein